MKTNYNTKISQQWVQNYAPSQLRRMIEDGNTYCQLKDIMFDVIDDLADGKRFNGCGDKNTVRYWIKQYTYLNMLFNKTYDDILYTSNGLWDKPYTIGLKNGNKEPILNEAEKKYLSAVIEPFKDKILWVKKWEVFDGMLEIRLNDGRCINIPTIETFKCDGMESTKQYYLEDLGL